MMICVVGLDYLNIVAIQTSNSPFFHDDALNERGFQRNKGEKLDDYTNGGTHLKVI